jgi:hypothetical protein
MQAALLVLTQMIAEVATYGRNFSAHIEAIVAIAADR